MDFFIKKGLDLPIKGHASTDHVAQYTPSKVALLGADYVGMKPTMAVEVGDHVKTGQVLFSCKKNIGLKFTTPATGEVIEINRGEKRVFQSIVIKCADQDDHIAFPSYKGASLDAYTSNELRDLLVASGQWAAIRQRPFDKVAPVEGQTAAIFVTATDTHPLSPDPAFIISRFESAFHLGLDILAKLTEAKLYICVGQDSAVHSPLKQDMFRARFVGPHPAGNVGTHIHMIQPAHLKNPVWHIGYQDVIALGYLLETGQTWTQRAITIAGPRTLKPHYALTRKGACITDMAQKDALDQARIVSGSILHGHTAQGPFDYLGHFHNQVTVLEEDRKRTLLGWHAPGFDRFSVKNVFVSKLFPSKRFGFTSTTHGSPRAIVPIGSFEKVTALNILPTQLLRALSSKDTDSAQDLGCLELAEEDMGLYTFVSPGKIDFGPILRENLTQIEKEG